MLDEPNDINLLNWRTRQIGFRRQDLSWSQNSAGLQLNETCSSKVEKRQLKAMVLPLCLLLDCDTKGDNLV